MSVADLPSTLGDAERTAIGEFVDFIRGRFGRRVRQLQLFGSRARGEGNEDSDVDILVVIDDLTGGEQREVWHRTGD
ncbi:MAG: nucleotidyltransferase domain-containing protein, partial [Planctomycetes bacterium]|nr:nucleotidyltransferase domain-containing protein [Planctomycetota bacterium]